MRILTRFAPGVHPRTDGLLDSSDQESSDEVSMKKVSVSAIALLLVLIAFTVQGFADTIVLKDGTSYNGEYSGPAVTFTDMQGAQYQFPLSDVQSLAFNASSDAVTLRNGKSYSGHFTGPNPVAFQGSEGIKYQFPTSDLDAIVFNGSGNTPPPPRDAMVIPNGADVPIRTNETIDSTSSYQGQTYSAVITEDIQDVAGNTAIPAGTPARLLIRNTSTGGAVHSAELVLDLYSVTVGKKEYRVMSPPSTKPTAGGLARIAGQPSFLAAGRRWARCWAECLAAARGRGSAPWRERAAVLRRRCLPVEKK